MCGARLGHLYVVWTREAIVVVKLKIIRLGPQLNDLVDVLGYLRQHFLVLPGNE